ncbi:MAG: hypothetical protein DI616_04210 [Paracoccus denitrificans]|uniref:Uncharacterized protein n=1 Tax=Paracoccus denitrificans TaxID=266 RepID=A0A533IBS4_PARDE|nr:MAG: hypothetical protein DI616_04210 [Paracoccus denitrificans]
MTGISRWRLAWAFLALALPLQLLIWRVWILPDDLHQSQLAGLAYLLAPVLAAAIMGAIWRARLPARPDLAMRRPYSRAMAYLLFASDVLLLWFVMWLALRMSGIDAPDNPLAMLFTNASILFNGKGLILLIPSLLFQFLICLIQTEVGLFLGVWLMDSMASHNGSLDR